MNVHVEYMNIPLLSAGRNQAGCREQAWVNANVRTSLGKGEAATPNVWTEGARIQGGGNGNMGRSSQYKVKKVNEYYHHTTGMATKG